MKQVGLRVGLSGDSFQLKIVTTIRYSCINECINSSAKFGSVCLFELLTLLTYAKKVRGWGRSRGRNPSRVVYDSTDRLLAIFTTAKSTINKPHTNASSQSPLPFFRIALKNSVKTECYSAITMGWIHSRSPVSFYDGIMATPKLHRVFGDLSSLHMSDEIWTQNCLMTVSKQVQKDIYIILLRAVQSFSRFLDIMY